MLETQRGFLAIAFAALSFFLFTTWQSEANKPKTEAVAVSEQRSVTEESDAPVVNAVADVPNPVAEQTANSSQLSQRYATLQNDVLRVVVDRLGGDIVEADLLQYKESLDADAKPIRILHNSNNRFYVAQTGIAGKNGPDANGRGEYSLSINDDANVAVLNWKSATGLSVVKSFRLSPGSYQVDVVYTVDNQSAEAFTGQVFTQFKRDRFAPAAGITQIGTYTGAAFGTTDKRYNKYSFDDMDKEALKTVTDGGWVAYMQHYFLSAWVPGSAQGNEISSRVLNDKKAIIGIVQPAFSVQAGQRIEQTAALYIGPKIQDELAKIANGLDLTVDYGFLWWIGQPLFWFLSLMHSWLGNWGIAIILVTVAVKTLLFPLSNAQYRSFAKMRKLQPKLEQLKERYGDDRQAFGQAMMELYKKEKVNPLGGCFPLLLQMPVFFALYWVLLESVEMRQAPFFGWIHDLSAMDPYYVLPLLMGVSMWFMQKLQPVSPTMDPMQQKMMQYMPILMTVFFIWAPAGLVLYWFCNNLLSIAQQVFITKRIEAEDNKKK